MIKKICNYPQCQTLIDLHERYCPVHKVEYVSNKVPFAGAKRYNDGMYNNERWRALRRKVLGLRPFCESCGVSKNDVPSLHVHHIKPPRGNEELFYDENNLGVLCPSCHRLETARETRRRR